MAFQGGEAADNRSIGLAVGGLNVRHRLLASHFNRKLFQGSYLTFNWEAHIIFRFKVRSRTPWRAPRHFC